MELLPHFDVCDALHIRNIYFYEDLTMKKLLLTALISISLFSTNAFANGTKTGDPRSLNALISFNGTKTGDPRVSYNGTKTGDPRISYNGTKTGDPNSESNGTKTGDPSTNSNGTKTGDPNGRVIAKDSGYPTLMALLSKYFSI